MRSLRMLASSALALVLLSDFVPAPPDLGPCIPGATFVPFVPRCEPTCSFVCFDECKRIIYVDGRCADSTGPCTEMSFADFKRVCRDCSCPSGGGACTDLGIYNSGWVVVTDC